MPVAFLADYKTEAGNTFNIGLVILILAAAALFTSCSSYRLVDEAGGATLSDVLGIAPFAAVAGGVAVLVAGGRRHPPCEINVCLRRESNSQPTG